MLAIAGAVLASLPGCSLDFVPWPPDGEAPAWPAPDATSTVSTADPHDPAQDPHLALARFGFLMMAAGGLAGVVALQQWMQTSKDLQLDPSRPGDTKFDAFMRQREPAIAVPIAAFGLGVGIPIYVASAILAERNLEEAERRRLAPGP